MSGFKDFSEMIKLTANQNRAINALMSERTIKAAAEKTGLAERTIYRYLEQDNFKQELERREQLILNRVAREILTLTDGAVKVVAEILNGEITGDETANRRLAAKIILDYTLKFSEIRSLTERIERLEQSRDELILDRLNKRLTS
jgi:hypothetical protein